MKTQSLSKATLNSSPKPVSHSDVEHVSSSREAKELWVRDSGCLLKVVSVYCVWLERPIGSPTSSVLCSVRKSSRVGCPKNGNRIFLFLEKYDLESSREERVLVKTHRKYSKTRTVNRTLLNPHSSIRDNTDLNQV